MLLAVDQGTSSSKAVAIDAAGQVRATTSVAIGHATPRPGWVEQDPTEILDSVISCLVGLLNGIDGKPVAVGLSNQRESAVAWNAVTGQPMSALLGWQDRRTADRAQQMLADGLGDTIRDRSGLPLDPMFSALKFGWILDEIDPDRRRARNGEVRLGTVDPWLVDRLTGQFRIEAGNASRTQLMNITSLGWDDDLLELFNVPRAALPPIQRSDAPTAAISPMAARGVTIGFAGVLGDSHAALYGHGVREPGTVKATYGTGSSIMGLTAQPVPASTGLVHTLGWLTDAPARAFEGNILATGATLVWLAGLFDVTPGDLAEWATTVPDSAGVSLVPAFAGLGAPYWDASAEAVITGFDQGTNRTHVARAAFEAITNQIEDVLERADDASGQRIGLVLADGGPTSNNWLMQLQADTSSRVVGRPENSMLSVTGVAHLAGQSCGVWDQDAINALPNQRFEFRPATASSDHDSHRTRWAQAVSRARLTNH